MKTTPEFEFSLQAVCRARSMELEQFSLSEQTSLLTGFMYNQPANAAIISAIAHFEVRQYDRAQRMFGRALTDLPETSENHPSLAALHVFMAHSYWRDEELTVAYRSQQARFHYDRALSYWQELNEHELMVKHLAVLVTICLLCDRIDLGVEYAWRALLRAQNQKPPLCQSVIACYCQVATCMILCDRLGDAEKALQAALQHRAQAESVPRQSKNRELLRNSCQLFTLMSVLAEKQAKSYHLVSSIYRDQLAAMDSAET